MLVLRWYLCQGREKDLVHLFDFEGYFSVLRDFHELLFYDSFDGLQVNVEFEVLVYYLLVETVMVFMAVVVLEAAD